MPRKPAQSEIEPVRLYAGEDRRVPRTLLGELKNERDREISAMARGLATDFPDYRFRVGKVRALTTAIDLCEKTISDMSDD